MRLCLVRTYVLLVLVWAGWGVFCFFTLELTIAVWGLSDDLESLCARDVWAPGATSFDLHLACTQQADTWCPAEGRRGGEAISVVQVETLLAVFQGVLVFPDSSFCFAHVSSFLDRVFQKCSQQLRVEGSSPSPLFPLLSSLGSGCAWRFGSP